MEWKIPYFEYDVFARVAPGALTIVVARYIGMAVPKYWEPLLPPVAGALDAGVVFWGGLMLLAASYFIGLLYEGLLSFRWRHVSPAALRCAAKERTTWLRPAKVDGERLQCQNESSFKLLLQWLVCSKDEGVRNGFVHMHRFQAEARLCTYSVYPLCVLAVTALFKHDYWLGCGAVFTGLILVGCAWSREKRRWVQALAILDECSPDGDTAFVRLEQLQKGGNTQGHDSARWQWLALFCPKKTPVTCIVLVEVLVVIVFSVVLNLVVGNCKPPPTTEPTIPGSAAMGLASAEWPTFWVNLVYTAVTIGILVAAVWGDWLRSTILGPRLNIRLLGIEQSPTQSADNEPIWYCHLNVDNRKGWVPARSVKVLCTHFAKGKSDAPLGPSELRIPLQFTWAFPGYHALTPTIVSTDRCDLGYVSKSRGCFQFAFYVEPNNVDTSLGPGETAEIVAQVEAENSRSAPSIHLQVIWDGTWADNPKEMATHLVVREVAAS